MKKTILIVLMAVMVATPCFAQEVETDANFSLHGTQWEVTPITETDLITDHSLLSFYHDQVYMCSPEHCILKNFEISRSPHSTMKCNRGGL